MMTTPLDLDAMAARHREMWTCNCLAECPHAAASAEDVPALIAAHRDLTARLAGAEKAWSHWVEVAGEYEGEAIQLRRLLANAEARATQLRDALKEIMRNEATWNCQGVSWHLANDALSRVSRAMPPPQETP